VPCSIHASYSLLETVKVPDAVQFPARQVSWSEAAFEIQIMIGYVYFPSSHDATEAEFHDGLWLKYANNKKSTTIPRLR
jgi:hypothetical protein